jgi:hypothetical protein
VNFVEEELKEQKKREGDVKQRLRMIMKRWRKERVLD